MDDDPGLRETLPGHSRVACPAAGVIRNRRPDAGWPRRLFRGGTAASRRTRRSRPCAESVAQGGPVCRHFPRREPAAGPVRDLGRRADPADRPGRQHRAR
ncbi:MAG: hypothetical protein MZU95_13430 [Desulfomicrobium escambiense]|nr:hypothetical protein [Desulfomicrobium escambiense]